VVNQAKMVQNLTDQATRENAKDTAFMQNLSQQAQRLAFLVSSNKGGVTGPQFGEILQQQQQQQQPQPQPQKPGWWQGFKNRFTRQPGSPTTPGWFPPSTGSSDKPVLTASAGSSRNLSKPRELKI